MVLQAASASQASIAVTLLPVSGSDRDEKPSQGFQRYSVLSVFAQRRSCLRSGCVSALGSGWWPGQVGRAMEGGRLEGW